jgi:4,5-dihydroxyphthalate decarboxylase
LLNLRFASGGYDRMEAILRGVISADGIELDFNEINEPRRIFDGMLGEGAFDVSELSSSEYITRRARGDSPDDFPFVAIPVFPSRAFRHGFIFINKRSGIETPKDLEGKLIGVPQHSQTAAVWIRGHLQHDYGVDLSTLRWLEGSVEVAGEHAKIETTSPMIAPTLEPNETAKSMSDLLAAGEIDAILGSRRPESLATHPDVVRLFPNYREIERDFYARTHIHPIMHVIAIRRDVYDKDPWIAASLYRALDAAKDWAVQRLRISGAQHSMLPFQFADMDEVDTLFDGDPWPYGIEPNRPTLEALVRHLHEQHFIRETTPVEELFVPI